MSLPEVKSGIAVGFDNDWYGEEVGALVVLKSEARSQKSEVRSQKSDVRSQKSEFRNQRSEIRSQKSEVGGLKSEVGNEESDEEIKQSILKQCGEKLPFYKCPKVILFSDTIPVTSTGKYQRNKVKHLFAEWKTVQFKGK